MQTAAQAGCAPASASRVWAVPDGADDEAAIEQKFKAHSGMRAAGAPTHDLTVCGPADLWAGPAPYGIAGDASVHPRLPHEVRRAQGKHEGPVLMGGGVGGDGCPILTSHLRQHPYASTLLKLLEGKIPGSEQWHSH